MQRTVLQCYERWQWVLAAVHLASATFIVIYIASKNDKTYGVPVDVVARYTVWAAPGEKNEVADKQSCGSSDSGCRIFTIEEPVSTQFELTYTSAAFSFISGVHHLMVAAALAWPEQNAWYQWCLKNSVFPLRWLDYAITSALMLSVLAALFESPISLDVVVLAFCFQFLVVVSGTGSEFIWSREPQANENSVTERKFSSSLWKSVQPIDKNYEKFNLARFGGNALLYSVVGTILSAISAAFHLILGACEGAVFLLSFGALSISLRSKPQLAWLLDITRAQANTVISTPHGLLFWFTLMPYVAVFAVLFYKFYLGVNARDEDGLISTLGQQVPAGIRKPPNFVWIAIIGIFVTFSSFAVCHINKITLAKKGSLYDTIKYETIYGFLSFTSKIILLYDIFVGAVMRAENNITAAERDFDIDAFEKKTPPSSDDDDDPLAYITLAVTVSVSLLLGIASYYDTLLTKGRQVGTLAYTAENIGGKPDKELRALVTKPSMLFF